jgi:hypothetical protein
MKGETNGQRFKKVRIEERGVEGGGYVITVRKIRVEM